MTWRPTGLACVALGLAACTTPSENQAVVIDDVPYDLLGTVNSTPITESEPQGPFELELFFISEADETLVRVVRAREQPPGLQETIDALMVGPTEAELALVAMRPRLSESLNPVAASPTGGLLAITVSDEAQFRDLNNRLPSQVLVCTLTQFDNVEAVELRDSIGPIPLTGANSESIGSQARRENYNECEASDAEALAAAAVPGEDDTPAVTDDAESG
jgi:hypothetical protein